MVIVIAVFEENVVLGRDLIVNLNSIDEKKQLMLLFPVKDPKVST